MIKIDKNKKFFVVTSMLVLMIFATFLISLNTGSLAISPVDVINTLLGQGSKSHEIAIFDLRLPRILVGILVGVSLAISGAILQGVTRNDLVDSGILGINSGSALFVVVYIFLMNGNVYEGISDLTIFTMPLVALSGAIFGAFLIYLLIIFQLKFTTQEFNRVMAWTNGSIWGSSWKHVLALLPFVVVLVFLSIYKHRYLDVLNLGDELSIGLGVNVERERRKLLTYSVILAGVSTAFAGSIAFLGLIAPHIARKLVGPEHKRLIPTSALVGALILLIGDTIARNLIAPMEIPVGIVISVIGVPYFIYLILSE